MTNQELSQLKKLIALCRKAGVSSFSQGDTSFTLGSAPTVYKTEGPKVKKKHKLSTPDGDIETDSPTEEELLMWSVRDEPEANA